MINDDGITSGNDEDRTLISSPLERSEKDQNSPDPTQSGEGECPGIPGQKNLNNRTMYPFKADPFAPYRENGLYRLYMPESTVEIRQTLTVVLSFPPADRPTPTYSSASDEGADHR
jgi:hypothetical protein